MGHMEEAQFEEDDGKEGHGEEGEFEEGEGKEEEQLEYKSNLEGGLLMVAEKVKLTAADNFGHKCMLSNIMTMAVKRYTSLFSSVFASLFLV